MGALIVRLLSECDRPTAPERAFRTRLQIGVDIVNIVGKVRIIGETFHDRNSLALAIDNDAPESFGIGQSIDQGRAEA